MMIEMCREVVKLKTNDSDFRSVQRFDGIKALRFLEEAVGTWHFPSYIGLHISVPIAVV